TGGWTHSLTVLGRKAIRGRFSAAMALPASSESTRSLRRDVAVSVVVPVYNEEASLRELHRRLRTVLEPLGQSFEVIYVDDGSTDASREVLADLGRDDACLVFVEL